MFCFKALAMILTGFSDFYVYVCVCVCECVCECNTCYLEGAFDAVVAEALDHLAVDPQPQNHRTDPAQNNWITLLSTERPLKKILYDRPLYQLSR